jgi:hypothetical protein
MTSTRQNPGPQFKDIKPSKIFYQKIPQSEKQEGEKGR